MILVEKYRSKYRLFNTQLKLIILSLFAISSCVKDDASIDTTQTSFSVEQYYNRIDSTIITLDKDSVIIYLEDKLQSSPKHPVEIAEIYFNLYKGQLLAKQKNYNGAIDLLIKAEEKAQSLNLNELQLKCRRYLGSYYTTVDKLDLAVTILRGATDISPLEYPNVLDEVFYELARIYYTLDRDMDKAYFYLGKAMREAKNIDDRGKIARYNHLFSTIYQARGEYAKADSCLAISLHYFENPKNLQNNILNQGYFFYLYQTLAISYASKEQESKSISTYKKALKLSEQYHIDGSNILTNIAQMYKYQGLETSVDSSIYYYKRYFEFVDSTRFVVNKQLLARSYKALGELYIKKKRYEDAYYLNNRYLAYRERFFEDDLEHSVIEMSKKYDLNIKEQEVKRLNREVSFAKRQLWGSVLVFVLSIIVASILAVSILNRKRYKQLLEQAQYKQRLLRSQMTPHLILNTITSIQHYIRLNENRLANKYLVKFSRLMQATIDNSAKSFVSIHREIEALRNYLDLQKMRFGELFSYEISSDFDLEDDFIFIPPMIIQPFVENSISHGFQGMKNGGVIKIYLVKREGYLFCTIDDNGVGLMVGNSRSSGRDRESMSSEITSDRLRLFGKQLKAPSGVEVLDKLAKFSETGVRVEINIPYK